MLYDTTKALDRQRLMTKLDHLIKAGKVVELTEKQTHRSLSQNAYHAVCISFVAAELGESYEYVNEFYYKRACNYEIFVRTKMDPVVGQVFYLRSSRDLTKAEMTLSIERFRNWASMQLGIYIPSPDDKEKARDFILEASSAAAGAKAYV